MSLSWLDARFLREEAIKLLNPITEKLEAIMATQQEFQTALSRVEAATTKAGEAATAIAARITALEDAIKNAGLDASQEAALLSQVQGLAANAEQLADSLAPMGQNPAQPVPVEPPPPINPEPTPGEPVV